MINKLAILCKYKENNNYWADYLKRKDYDILIFNKFNGDNLLPNVGREGHTYLHYIIDNYDNLENISKEFLFSQYDPMDHLRSYNINNFLNGYLYDFIGIRPWHQEKAFLVRTPKTRKYILFKDWFNKNIEIYNDICSDMFHKFILYGCHLNGVFRVTPQSIKRHPKSLYIKLISLLDKHPDPDDGYVIERLWSILFTSYGNSNNTLHHFFNDNIFMFGSNLYNSNIKEYGNIYLSHYGIILKSDTLYSHNNESYWSIANDNILRFFRNDGAITSSFVLKSDLPLIGNTFINNHLVLQDTAVLGKADFI